MDIHQLKQRIDASRKKFVTLVNDCMNTRTKPAQKCSTKHHNSLSSSITADLHSCPHAKLKDRLRFDLLTLQYVYVQKAAAHTSQDYQTT